MNKDWHLFHPFNKAKQRDHLLAGLDEFLDAVNVLPPGEWDPSIRIEPPQNVNKIKNKKYFKMFQSNFHIQMLGYFSFYAFFQFRFHPKKEENILMRRRNKLTKRRRKLRAGKNLVWSGREDSLEDLSMISKEKNLGFLQTSRMHYLFSASLPTSLYTLLVWPQL